MEIVVLDKVLQIDNGVWFLIFSVYLRVVRSLELQLFNYYLQWYSDTSNFLQFTNLHALVALRNRLYWIYGMERTLWLFLQKCIYQLSKSKKCLNTSGSRVKCLVFFKHELRSPCTTSPCVTASSLSAELGHPVSQSCAGAFVSVAPNSCPKVSGELKGAWDLAVGYPASFIKADSGNRKDGKHLALLRQYSI